MMYEGVHDLPTFNWWQANEKDDLSFLLTEPRTITKRLGRKLKQRWKLIREEYFDKIALNREVEKLFLKKARLQSLRCEILLTDNNHTRTLYMMLELEIDALEQQAAKNNIGNYEQKSVLDKYLGFRVDPKTMPILEYSMHLKMMSEEYKRLLAQSRNKN